MTEGVPMADETRPGPGIPRAEDGMAGTECGTPGTERSTAHAGPATRLFATCPMGFESLLADELSSLGLPRVRALRGQVSFGEGLGDAYKACLWSRLASRVILVLGHVDATSSDALYEGLSRIAWEDHLPPSATMAIDAHGTNAALRNSQFVALRSKDAVVDRLMSRRGSRPVVDTSRPDVTIAVRVQRERAVVGIDLTGEPLFRRGYESARKGRAPIAPLRSDYAAALLAYGGWFRNCRHEGAAVAVVHSGTGTVLVEAASQALGRAPGLLRARWGFDGWMGHDAGAWQDLLDDACGRADAIPGRGVRLLACDGRRGAQEAAVRALRAAGMDVAPAFGSAAEVGALLSAEKNALAVCDLSWVPEDEVALEAMALADVAAALVPATAGLPAQTGVVAVARDATVDSALGCKPDTTLGILVGQSDATIRSYTAGNMAATRPQVSVADRNGRQVGVPVFVEASDQFAARLSKVYRQRRKWAQREDVSCYRIYDADLPDYAVTIDLFQGSELMAPQGARRRWLQVYEYAAPKDVDVTLARRRLLDVLAIAPRVLGVEPQDVFVRVRSHGRGGSQYASQAAGDKRDGRGMHGARAQHDGHDGRGEGGIHAGRRGHAGRPTLSPGAHLVDEGGLTFEVNFSTRLDCGLFLDHRETRSLVREMMKQTQGSKRFLNLFAYTGTATCYAADGGAKHTTTVDMSRPSLDWARRNMDRNGFSNGRPGNPRERRNGRNGPGRGSAHGRNGAHGSDDAHEYVQADVIHWVSAQRRTKNRWDLIFCDVPTFSNSKRMGRGSWDVQRDHAELIIGLSRLLTRNGRAIFSCNLRNFRPDVDKLERAGVALEDITEQTIPEDFRRNAKVHHAYIVRRTGNAAAELS